MKENNDSKIRVRKKHKKSKFDTLSITMELEKSLSIDKELDKERERLKKLRKKKIYKNAAILVGVLIVVIMVSFFYNINQTYKLTKDVSDYTVSNKDVRVIGDKNDNLIFTPTYKSKKSGIIIVPSEKVGPKSYAYMANKLANKGYKVIVLKLKMNYPAFSKSLLNDVVELNIDVKNWYVVGHSLSSDMVMSESAMLENISGVVFLGAYPNGDDLKLINKPTLFVSGSKDGIIDYNNYKINKNEGSKNTYNYQIEGGNNTNFADAELFKNDNKALLEPKRQKDITIEKILEFIDNTSNRN